MFLKNFEMAAVYKALSKSAGDNKDDAPAHDGAVKRNKQRVLILSSRGVTYRYGGSCLVSLTTCYMGDFFFAYLLILFI